MAICEICNKNTATLYVNLPTKEGFMHWFWRLLGLERASKEICLECLWREKE